ncbi:MAG: RNA-binding cell elongation regulator Jag/EloR [Candidatus Sumerlaeaceae bacterium]|jgi:spoIIIJ-associated protein
MTNAELRIPDVTISADSYEEAVAEGMRQLGVPADAVEIEKLDHAHEETLPGAEPLPGVTVRFRLKPDMLLEHARRHVEKILELLGIPAKVTGAITRRGLVVNIEASADGALVIGKGGQNLDALQFLVARMVLRSGREIVPILVDSEGYRERHYAQLEQLAKRAARKALRFKREVALKPMPPADRKIIHLALREFRGVHTISRGEEGNRRVVITPAEGTAPPRGVVRGRRPMRREGERRPASFRRQDGQQVEGSPGEPSAPPPTPNDSTPTA